MANVVRYPWKHRHYHNFDLPFGVDVELNVPLLWILAEMHDSYDVLQFSRLLLDFGRQEYGGGRYRLPRKVGERVKYVETMHVNDRRIDA